MPLTPADVHNVAFSKPPIGKRGYNEDEVDAFLDLVEGELARLIEENNELRNQIEQLDQQLDNTRADLEDARAGAAAAPASRPAEEPRRLSPVPAPSMVEQTAPGGDHHVQAAKVLGLAQEMADRLTGEAKAEADGMLSEARTKSEQLLSEARTKSDGLVNEARTRAETMLGDARTRSEAVERQSREKAATLERDAQRKHSEILAGITQEKNSLDKEIEVLRTFEREYRTRLKTMLDSQLRELEDRGSAVPPIESTRSSHQTGYSFGGRTAEAG
ncbi:DivIVA-like cell division protein Wag31 [Actinoalloteichus hymeniacidonis]|uniref:Cell wall synthesis protein Wag31 n=1 Tax=Actinoalloteichus hymeniacidonis TaxID=340345 RepID=A0AAC9HNY8_9PSEU|nr:DivIVA domain-containing protein [Actinoalloteichus hymeniacidonis]AOS62726.1 DivIVA domain [Actinoalloteichus hymeniacidonis]MBB5909243.1 DivIVA domain-containing protein [Actinoalloteichus hymeniacidonis]